MMNQIRPRPLLRTHPLAASRAALMSCQPDEGAPPARASPLGANLSLFQGLLAISAAEAQVSATHSPEGPPVSLTVLPPEMSVGPPSDGRTLRRGNLVQPVNVSMLDFYQPGRGA